MQSKCDIIVCTHTGQCSLINYLLMTVLNNECLKITYLITTGTNWQFWTLNKEVLQNHFRAAFSKIHLSRYSKVDPKNKCKNSCTISSCKSDFCALEILTSSDAITLQYMFTNTSSRKINGSSICNMSLNK